MRIAVAQLNFTIGAFDENYAKIETAVLRAGRENAELVVFSELAICGYPPRDLLYRESFVQSNLEILERVVKLSRNGPGILVGYVQPNPADAGNPVFNAAALCEGGQLLAKVYKCLLPTYDVFDEDRYFEPARELAPVLFRGKQLGITICEDIWNDVDFWPKRRYARDPVTELVAKGAEILINISASPFTLGKPELRCEMLRQMAAKHERTLICVNQICGQDEIVFDGHSQIIDAKGMLVLALKGFEEDFAVYDLEASTSPILHARKKTRVEQAHAALVLGLRDYARKCGFTEVVLGLSGGIDSALTACLAAEALGPDKVLGVSMPSRYSSEHSKDDARELAEGLGIRYDVIPIEEPFQAYLNCLADAFRGRPADVTEENLQARVRGAILMALSNKTGSLLLSTGNKSELAVGYCTLYGDMCGGLAVLSDVPKTLLYEIAAYVNRDRIVIPRSTLEKAPSAELRPDQVDQDSLPPYDVLDGILELYVEENRGLEEIVDQGFDRAVVSDLLQRIDSNVYKRRQAAPGIKISSKAFGIGRRFPIAARTSLTIDPKPET